MSEQTIETTEQTPEQAKTEKPAKVEKPVTICWCGCNGQTKGGRFLPGHDARVKGRLDRINRGVDPFSNLDTMQQPVIDALVSGSLFGHNLESLRANSAKNAPEVAKAQQDKEQEAAEKEQSKAAKEQAKVEKKAAKSKKTAEPAAAS